MSAMPIYVKAAKVLLTTQAIQTDSTFRRPDEVPLLETSNLFLYLR